MQLEQLPDPCPLCGRPNYHPSDHHLIPKSRGGKVTKNICGDCHNAIHKFWSNKELEKTYHTVEIILADPQFARHVAWLRKQDPKRRMRTDHTRERRRRGIHRGR